MKKPNDETNNSSSGKKSDYNTNTNSSNNFHSKKNSYAYTSSNSKLFTSDLDKELQAAERFLSKNNEDILKNNKQIIYSTGESDGNYNKNDSNNLNSSNSNNSNNSNSKVDQILIKYRKQLKSFGFPEIGNFFFAKDSQEDKEKTFHFFDYIIMKKTSENEEKMKYKKQIDSLSHKINLLQIDNERLEKELNQMKDELKNAGKEKKDFESKLNKSKETIEKQLKDLKSNNTKLLNKHNFLLAEKKGIEEKYNKLAEAYHKLLPVNKSSSTRNSIDMIDNLKKNDIIRILSKVTGTEKLIETFKNGFNESLRELLFEISALKNFIYEINSDLIRGSNNKFMDIDYNLLNMPFLDTVTKMKLVFQHNIKLIRGNNNNNYQAKEISFIVEDQKSNLNNNSGLYNDFDLTFDRNFDKNLLQKEEKTIFNNQNLIFNIEDENRAENKTNNTNFEDDYENELEFLKNKWVKTLMNIKNPNTDNNDDDNSENEN